MSLLAPDTLAVLALIALATGFVKAGVPSIAALLSAIVALLFPPRDALGITLLYLMVGDIVSVSLYWRQAHWGELLRMLPPVVVGIVGGGLLLGVLDNDMLGLTIGLVVLLLVSLEPLRPRLTGWALTHPRQARTGAGLLGGVATTIGNAAGPVLSLYFLLLKMDKRGFVGTGTIFYLFVNLSKVPIFLSLDVFQAKYYGSVLLTAPLVFAGAFGGKRFLDWIPQHWFNRLILACTAFAGAWLVLRWLWIA